MNIQGKMLLAKRLKELVSLLGGEELSATEKLKFVKETQQIIEQLGGKIESNEQSKEPPTELPAEPEEPQTSSSFEEDLTLFAQFVGSAQLEVVKTALQVEEKEAFVNIVQDMAKTIREMPKSYETDGQGLKAIAHLHYFIGSSEWYITEKDSESEQKQAFGLVPLNGDYPELGYISIEKITKQGAELDFYYTPQILQSISNKLAGNDEETSPKGFFDALLSGAYDHESNTLEGFSSLLTQIEDACTEIKEGNPLEEKAKAALKYWANLAESVRERVFE